MNSALLGAAGPSGGPSDGGTASAPKERGIKGFIQRKQEHRAAKKQTRHAAAGRPGLERDSVDPMHRAADRAKRKSRSTTEHEVRPPSSRDPRPVHLSQSRPDQCVSTKPSIATSTRSPIPCSHARPAPDLHPEHLPSILRSPGHAGLRSCHLGHLRVHIRNPNLPRSYWEVPSCWLADPEPARELDASPTPSILVPPEPAAKQCEPGSDSRDPSHVLAQASSGSPADASRTVYLDGGRHAEGYAANNIKTSKYNPITFLPIFLFEMFSRIAYLYFLFQVRPWPQGPSRLSLGGGLPA